MCVCCLNPIGAHGIHILALVPISILRLSPCKPQRMIQTLLTKYQMTQLLQKTYYKQNIRLLQTKYQIVDYNILLISSSLFGKNSWLHAAPAAPSHGHPSRASDVISTQGSWEKPGPRPMEVFQCAAKCCSNNSLVFISYGWSIYVYIYIYI